MLGLPQQFLIVEDGIQDMLHIPEPSEVQELAVVGGLQADCEVLLGVRDARFQGRRNAVLVWSPFGEVGTNTHRNISAFIMNQEEFDNYFKAKNAILMDMLDKLTVRKKTINSFLKNID